MTPAVSIAIPVYDGEPFLRATLASALAQTCADIEVVVADHGSSDASLETVRGLRDPRVRVVETDRALPIAANWNRAVAASQAPFVKLLCQDDLIEPDCVERQLAAMRAHPDVALVAARRHIVDERGRVLVGGRGLAGMEGQVGGREAIRRTVRSGANALGEGAAVLFDRAAFDATGGFAEELPYVTDLAAWLRILVGGDLYAISEPLASFRVHRGGWSRALARRQAAQPRALYLELHATPASGIGALDWRIGSARARGLNWARRALYSRPGGALAAAIARSQSSSERAERPSS